MIINYRYKYTNLKRFLVRKMLIIMDNYQHFQTFMKTPVPFPISGTGLLPAYRQEGVSTGYM
jgi:hypothetical protein